VHVTYNNDEFDKFFQIERILSIGHIIYLDKNKDNEKIENLKLLCYDCFESKKNMQIKNDITLFKDKKT
jgi:5-methylcytosine-specific restriction endonuclease McrA